MPFWDHIAQLKDGYAGASRPDEFRGADLGWCSEGRSFGEGGCGGPHSASCCGKAEAPEIAQRVAVFPFTFQSDRAALVLKAGRLRPSGEQSFKPPYRSHVMPIDGLPLLEAGRRLLLVLMNPPLPALASRHDARLEPTIVKSIVSCRCVVSGAWLGGARSMEWRRRLRRCSVWRDSVGIKTFV